MRTTLAAAVVVTAGVLGVATPAKAQEFASKGTAAFGADRLFGLTLHHESDEVGNNQFVTQDSTDFGLAWRPTFDIYEVPRFSFDYFLMHGLELGGSLAFASYGGDRADNAAFLLAPRVGYCWMFTDSVGFWLRGGITYHNRDGHGREGEWGLAFSAQGMFVFSPVDHFAFELGPTFDITMVGKRTRDNGPDLNRHYRDIGIFNFGLMGWL